MLPKKNGFKKWLNVVSVGWFLAKRQIKGGNLATTILIVFIMMLTFLNLVVVSGILVGLLEGANIANKEQYTGDIIITTPAGENYIEKTHELESTLAKMRNVSKSSIRFIENGQIEANYKTRRNFDEVRDIVGTQIVGLDVEDENALTGLSHFVTEGEFLSSLESGQIVIGANLLYRYSSGFGDFWASLDGVFPGDEVRVTIGDRTKTFIVKGIADTKVDAVSLRAFITKEDFLRLVERPGLNANEISIRLSSGAREEAITVKNNLVKLGFGQYGKIQTFEEAIPEFLNQIKIAFGLLGNVIGLVGIVVASITIFIVIYINAVTRRKYIGIMKGIGISEQAIEISYIFQSIFYATLGGLAGIILIYTLLVPLFLAHPLDFPFSDGILVAPVDSTLWKFLLLMIVTLLAGYIPARRIVKKNTLDSILGR